MPGTCCVPGCRSNYRGGNKAHVFGFPLNNKNLLKSWIHAIPRSNFIPTKYSKVCEHHFKANEILKESSHFDQKAGKLVTAPLYHPRLKEGTIPSQFPECPHLMKNSFTRESPNRKRWRSEDAAMKKTEEEVISSHEAYMASCKTLVNALQRPTNGVNEKSVVSSSELPIPVSKIKQETEEVIIPSNDVHLIYTLNQRPKVPVIINVRSGDIDDDDSDKHYQDSNTKKKQAVPVVEASLPERKRIFPDSNENSFIEEYYKAKLEVLNKEHNAKLNAIKAEYELKIKFLKEEYEYKLEYLKSKKEYKLLKKLKLQNT